MKTDKEIAEEARDWWRQAEDDVADACEKAITLARQYGALPAPAAPLSFVEQAAIAAMQGILAAGYALSCETVVTDAVANARALDAALKKGGAA